MAHSEQPIPWVPTKKLHVHNAPPDRPLVDQRWRDNPPAPGSWQVQEDSRERSKRSVADQCLNARMPGYSGFIPSARAEDVYGRTQAAVGRHAVREQERRREQQEQNRQLATTTSSSLLPDDYPTDTRGPGSGVEHVLGTSSVALTRNHWVPTIPGYGGFIPAKEAENIHGGTTTYACRLAGRAIAERRAPSEPAPLITAQDEVQRSRIKEYWHAERPMDEKMRMVDHLNEHCHRHIPGYTGHIPRVAGDSIYGATQCEANRLAATMCEDKIINPHDHFRSTCVPQFPAPRKLRM